MHNGKLNGPPHTLRCHCLSQPDYAYLIILSVSTYGKAMEWLKVMVERLQETDREIERETKKE